VPAQLRAQVEDGDHFPSRARGEEVRWDGEFARAGEEAGDEVVRFEGGWHGQVWAGFGEGGIGAEGAEEGVLRDEVGVLLLEVGVGIFLLQLVGGGGGGGGMDVVVRVVGYSGGALYGSSRR